MAQKSTREGLKKEYVDYLGNLIIDGKIKEDILKCFKMDLLWELVESQEAFGPNNVDLDLSKYKFVYINFHEHTSTGYISKITKVGENDQVITVKDNGTSNALLTSRKYSVSQNGVKFFSGSYCYLFNEGRIAADNSSCVPYKIYGVR